MNIAQGASETVLRNVQAWHYNRGCTLLHFERKEKNTSKSEAMLKEAGRHMSIGDALNAPIRDRHRDNWLSAHKGKYRRL